MIIIYWLATIIVIVQVVNSKHFLGGTINWRLSNSSATGTPVNIVITQTYSWTHFLVECTEDMTATNQLIPINGTYVSLGNRTLDCIASCGSSGGYVAPSIRPYCTDISASVGTTVAQRLDSVSIQAGADFFVGFNDSSWRELAQGTGAVWSIASRINLTPRPDNGKYNNAPVATMMSPINIPKDQNSVIHVPIGDADGDNLRCRWSNLSSGVDECGATCPPNSLPSNTTIFPNCTIIITGTIIDKWYAVTLMVEDFIDSSSSTPLSATPVQFLVHVVEMPSCIIPPKVIGLPIEQSCTPLLIGQTYSSILYAHNSCGSNVTIVDIATLSYAGVLKDNTTMINDTTWYKEFTWTPTATQLGYQVVCAMAFDSQDSQSSQYCFKFFVSEVSLCNCPGETCITTSSTTFRTTTTTTMTTTTMTTTMTTTTTTTTKTTSSTSTSTTTSTTTTSSSTSSSTTTSTTTTTTTTTTTITMKPSNPIDWPLLGSILGVLLLSICLLCCLLPYLWSIFCQKKPNQYEQKKIVEFYSIDRCTDPICRTNSSFNQPLKNYRIYSIRKDHSATSSDETDISITNELHLNSDSFISNRSARNFSSKAEKSEQGFDTKTSIKSGMSCRTNSANGSVRVIRLRSSQTPKTKSPFLRTKMQRVRVGHVQSTHRSLIDLSLTDSPVGKRVLTARLIPTDSRNSSLEKRV